MRALIPSLVVKTEVYPWRRPFGKFNRESAPGLCCIYVGKEVWIESAPGLLECIEDLRSRCIDNRSERRMNVLGVGD
jgi:hypothetical protein